MFFNITNPQGPTEVYKHISTTAKDGFKPEHGFEVLSHTNNYVVIKKMLNEIKKLPIESQKDFKDVVIASIEGRETSAESIALMTELAIAGGYEATLTDADKKKKIYKARIVKDATKNKKKSFFNKSKVKAVE